MNEQEQKLHRLEQMLMEHVRKRQSESGVWSVVSLADWSKVRATLQPDVLRLKDGKHGIRKLGKNGPNARAVRLKKGWGDEARGYERETVQIFLRIDISIKSHLSTTEFATVMHELVHAAEILHDLDLHDDWRHYAYRERNGEFIGKAIPTLDTLYLREKTLMSMNDDLSQDENRNLVEALSGFFKEIQALQYLEKGGGAASAVRAEVKNWEEKGEILYWPPNRVELWTLLGIKLQSRTILEHYASGACGEKLKQAARMILRFDDEEDRRRQQAITFTKVHRMSDKEAEEHLHMVDLRLDQDRQAFLDMLDEDQFLLDFLAACELSKVNSEQKDNWPTNTGPAWYSHWKCINCAQSAKTAWNQYPEGQCPPTQGGGNHNWEFQTKTER